jgi:c-di-GMP-binding flagellar brake protein YcgR
MESEEKAAELESGKQAAGKAQFASPSQAKIAPRERRVQAREEVDTTAVIFLINIASRLQGRILDLSLGGCRIRADERFPVGIYTRVETEFRLEGLPFRLGGVVQAIHDRRTVGIRFLDMSSRKREQVAQLIEEIRQLRELGTEDKEQRQGTRE